MFLNQAKNNWLRRYRPTYLLAPAILPLRSIPARKPMRVLLAAAMAAPVFLLAASPPASATGVQRVCEHFGPRDCVGAPHLGLYDKVEATTDGRYLDLNNVGDGYKELVFNAALRRGLCVAAGTSGVDVVIHACNGGDGTFWQEIRTNGKYIFKNREFGNYLSCAGEGTQCEILYKGHPDWEQTFDIRSA